MKIHLLWCTLRSEQFKKMHTEWINRSDNSENIISHVGVNFQHDYDNLKKYLKESDRLIITETGGRIGVCLPSYLLSSTLEGEDCDVVVFASDDFIAPNGWDTYLINKLKDKGDVCLMVRDGYQLPDSSNMLHPAITIPIMTYGCLKKMNMVIYHPAYHHMFSDCELYNTAKDLGMLYDDRLNDVTIFEHLHYAAGKRNADQADQIYNSKWASDSGVWEKRKLMSVEERIKVNIYEKES